MQHRGWPAVNLAQLRPSQQSCVSCLGDRNDKTDDTHTTRQASHERRERRGTLYVKYEPNRRELITYYTNDPHGGRKNDVQCKRDPMASLEFPCEFPYERAPRPRPRPPPRPRPRTALVLYDRRWPEVPAARDWGPRRLLCWPPDEATRVGSGASLKAPARRQRLRAGPMGSNALAKLSTRCRVREASSSR